MIFGKFDERSQMPAAPSFPDRREVAPRDPALRREQPVGE
jgi:hypothetical protein